VARRKTINYSKNEPASQRLEPVSRWSPRAIPRILLTVCWQVTSARQGNGQGIRRSQVQSSPFFLHYLDECDLNVNVEAGVRRPFPQPTHTSTRTQVPCSTKATLVSWDVPFPFPGSENWPHLGVGYLPVPEVPLPIMVKRTRSGSWYVCRWGIKKAISPET